METDWIVQRDSAQFRAPDIATLIAWAREGRVLPSDWVWSPVLQEWRLAANVDELAGHQFSRSDAVRAAGTERKNDDGCGWAVVLAVGVIAWCAYSWFYAPYERATQPPALVKDAPPGLPSTTENTPKAAVRAVLGTLLPLAEPRLEFLQGANLNIYIHTNEFQTIPFPDREQAMEAIGKSWCDRVEGTFLPVVKIRDVKTGKVLASYSCTSGNAKVPPGGG